MTSAAGTTTPTSVAPQPRRPWSTPVIRELPKLTELTLASLIGGGGGTGGGGSTVFGLLLASGLLLGLGACSADQVANEGAFPDVPPVASQLVTCTVDRAAETLACVTPEMAPGGGIIGAQGTHVALRSSGVSYSGITDILSATVTVQNLSVQAMGTQDGTTLSSGITVFFIAGPEGPSSEVIGLNADGTGTFTAPNQAFFNYAEVLAPQGTSAGKVWEFDMNGTASFTFSVLVAADLPALGGFLSWRPDPIAGYGRWDGVGGWGDDGLALLGDYGIRSFYDDGRWRSRPDPLGTNAAAGYANYVVNGPNEAFVITDDQLTIRYWDGISWRTITGLIDAPPLAGIVIASTGPGVLYASRDSVRMFTVDPGSPNGGSWSILPDPTGSGHFISATSAANGRLFVSYNSGKVYSWNGIAWDSSGNSGVPAPNIVVGTDTNDVWVYSAAFPGFLRHYSAGSWSDPATPAALSGRSILHAAAGPDGDIYAVGFQTGFPFNSFVWHWNGAAWSEELLTGSSLNQVWARDADTAYAVGTSNGVFRGVGGSWTQVAGHFGPAAGNTWTSVYVAAVNSIFIGASGGAIRRWNGSEWVAQPASSLNNIRSLWGTSGSNVYAAGGDYLIEQFDGNSWSPVSGFALIGANAVGGSGPNDVWAVGYDAFAGNGNIVHYDGTWAGSPSPDNSATLNAVWAGSPSLAVAVGNGGKIFRWNGTNWVEDASGTGSSLAAVWGASASAIWAVGDNGTIRRWDGDSWENGGSSCGGSTRLNGVWGRSATEVYAVSDGGHLCFFDGTSWSQIIGSSNLSSIINGIHGDALGTTAVTVGNQVFRAAR
jgi:hypothetical protein